jgi:hypothetical protein
MFGKRKAKKRTTRLGVEALDRRDTPSTGVALSGNVLNIVGDDAANAVQIAVIDATNQVRVQADGHTFTFASDQVHKINVNLKGGDDDLQVQLGAGGESAVTMTRAKTFDVNLGDGNDSARFTFGGLGLANRVIAAPLAITVHAGNGDDYVVGNFGEVRSALTYKALMGAANDEAFGGLWGKVGPGAAVKFDLHGEAGNDTLNTFATYVNDYDQVDIAFGATLDIGLSGGDGNDHLGTTYGGFDRGTLRVREDGGAGNDQVQADIHLNTIKFLPSFGTADVVLRGGSGFDNMELDVTGRAATHRFLIDGGTGFDRAKGTPNVEIINANELIILNPPVFIGNQI